MADEGREVKMVINGQKRWAERPWANGHRRAFLAVLTVLLLAGTTLLAFYQYVMPNLQVVRVGVLWRSGQPSRLGLRLARWAGVRTIVCLRGSEDAETQAEADYAKRHGILFIQNELRFSGESLDETIARFLEAVSDPERQPVLVHCARGQERSGVCGAVFRMEFDGWSNGKALEEMYALGFERGTIPSLEGYVASYRPRALLAGRAVVAGAADTGDKAAARRATPKGSGPS
jgi:protein tyrosine phosphatase (PTP) superfamily phosphohydrolase (DUF442 family)